jgi:hypothetical protein
MWNGMQLSVRPLISASEMCIVERQKHNETNVLFLKVLADRVYLGPNWERTGAKVFITTDDRARLLPDHCQHRESLQEMAVRTSSNGSRLSSVQAVLLQVHNAQRIRTLISLADPLSNWRHKFPSTS